MKRVSVIIPTYNRAETLRAAISSVLGQTFRDFEIVVVDDGSRDNTVDVVNAFGSERIRYVRHSDNRGEARARNTGLLNATGEYIAFLDDDDEWLPEKLSAQINLLDSSDCRVGLVYCGYLTVDRDSRKVMGRIIPDKRGFLYDKMLNGTLIGAPSTVVIRRECLTKVGMFDENISYGLDHDLWIRISRHYHFEYVGEPLVKYHLHSKRLSTNPDIKARGIEDMMHKYGRSVILGNEYYRSSFLAIGIEFCDQGNMARGRYNLLRAIRYNPLQINPYFYFVISLLSQRSFQKLKKWKERAVACIRQDGKETGI